MTRPLTARQREVLDWIAAYIAREHRAPSRREIGAGVGGIGMQAVEDHLEALAKKGAIVWTPLIGRGLRLVGRCALCGHKAGARGGR